MDSNFLPITTHGQFGHLFNDDSEMLSQVVTQTEAKFIDEVQKFKDGISYVKSGKRDMKVSARAAKYAFDRVWDNLYRSTAEEGRYTVIEKTDELVQLYNKTSFRFSPTRILVNVGVVAFIGGLLAVSILGIIFGFAPLIPMIVLLVAAAVVAIVYIGTFIGSPRLRLFWKRMFIQDNRDKIFVVDNKASFDEANKLGMLAIYRTDKREDQTVTDRLQKQYERRTIWARGWNTVRMFFGGNKTTKLGAYTSNSIKSILYDNMGDVTFAFVELSKEELADPANKGKKYKIVPVKEGALIDQQLGSPELVAALALLSNKQEFPIYKDGKDTGRKATGALSKIVMPKEVGASISANAVFNQKGTYNYPTAATEDDKLLQAKFGVAVVRLGSVTSEQYAANVVADDVTGEALDAAYEHAQENMGKKVVLKATAILGDTASARKADKIEKTSQMIVNEYLTTGTAQLFHIR